MQESLNTTQKVEFIDNVSTANIPEQLVPFIDDAVSQLKDLLGEKLISVYLHGSTVRGDFIEGLGNIDAFVITTGINDTGIEVMVDKLLDEINQNMPYKFDAAQRDVEDFYSGNLPYNSTVLSACGACYFGQEIDFTKYIPPKDQMLEMLVGFYKEVLDAYSVLPQDELARKDSRRLLKFAVRTLGLAAVKVGAPMSTSINTQVELATQYLPNLVSLVQEISDLLSAEQYPQTQEALELLRLAYDTYEHA